MSALKISIGADPELFCRNKTTGLFVSAHDKIPGTKDQPHKVPLGAVQVDGVAAEFNIDPSYSAKEFLLNIETVQTQLQNFAGEDLELVAEPTVEFSSDYFKSLPDSVRELGCNPDFNAWTGQVNDKPDGDSTTMRTGAGHIHIGWCNGVDPSDPVHFEDCRIVTKQLDYYLGMYSLMWDSDTKRRSLYGKAGAFRPKPYGVEYRSLSNVWLRSPRLQSWIWNSTYRALIALIQEGNRVEDRLGDSARSIIDNSENWWSGDKTIELWKHTQLDNPPKLSPDGVKKTSVGKTRKVKLYKSLNGQNIYQHPYTGHDLIQPTHEIFEYHSAEIDASTPGHYIDIETDVEI